MRKKLNITVWIFAIFSMCTAGLHANEQINFDENDTRLEVVYKDPGLTPIEVQRLKKLYDRYLRVFRAAAADGVITAEEREKIKKARLAYLSFKRKSRLD